MCFIDAVLYPIVPNGAATSGTLHIVWRCVQVGNAWSLYYYVMAVDTVLMVEYLGVLQVCVHIWKH